MYEYRNLDNLQDYLKRKGKLTEKQSLIISKQIINAYQFIKDKELIHGNIKPTNILIDEDNKFTIKLTDFLLNLKKINNKSDDKFTAPEIASRNNNPNIISDVYSIGAIINLLLQNTESSTDICSRLIEDCLQINPNKRIQFDILTLHPYFTASYPDRKSVV